jgi:hypothetical protein
MANIGQPLRLPRQDQAEHHTRAQQAVQGGTGVHAPFIPNAKIGDATEDQGRGQGGSQGQTDGQASALPGGAPQVGLRGPQQQGPVQRPWQVGDSVLQNLGPFGVSTYADGTLQRGDWNQRFAATQGKPLRIAGEMPRSWSRQIQNEQLAVSIQTRPMNRDFVANGRYNVPIRV